MLFSLIKLTLFHFLFPFLPFLHYCDLLLFNIPGQHLKRLYTVCYCALCFITSCKNDVHHCSLYAAAKCSFLNIPISVYNCFFNLKMSGRGHQFRSLR